jgi:hypothetical protein
MIENLEKKYPYENATRGAALEALSVPELIALLRDVHDANPDGDTDWKADIRSAIVRKSDAASAGSGDASDT